MTNIEVHSNKNIKIGALIGYISLALNIASGFLFVPLILKQIGSQYGLFSLATSIINIFLIDFGLSYTANVFLAKYKTEGDSKKTTDTLGLIYKIYFILDAIFAAIFVIFYFLIEHIYVGLSPEEIVVFKKVSIICFGYSLISLPASTLDGTISANEKFIFLKLSDLLQKIIYIAITTVSLIFKMGLLMFVLSHAASVVITILVKIVYVRFILKIKPNYKVKMTKALIKPILFFSAWSALISILARLPFNLSPNILGIVSDSENITVFGIASTIEGYAYLLSAVISGLFLPKVSRILKENNKNNAKLEKLAINVGAIQLVIIGLIFVGFIVCGRSFFVLWLGSFNKYSQAYFGLIFIIFNFFKCSSNYLQ